MKLSFDSTRESALLALHDGKYEKLFLIGDTALYKSLGGIIPCHPAFYQPNTDTCAHLKDKAVME